VEPEPPVAAAGVGFRVAFDRNAAHEHDAAAGIQLVELALDARGERAERLSARTRVGDRAVEVANLVGRQAMDPVAGAGELVATPRVRGRDGGGAGHGLS